MSKKICITFLTVILCMCGLLGCTDTSEIVKEHIDEEISVSGDFQFYKDLGYDARTEQCKGKHIQVEGILKEKYTSTILRIGSKKEDGFYISCTFDEKQEEIEEGD